MSCTVEGSSGSAVGAPMKSLIAAAMRLAVVKSGLRSARRNWPSDVEREFDLAFDDGAVGMRPTVGTPRVILAASPSAWKPPIGDRALGDRVDVAVGAEQRGDQQHAALQALGVAQRRDGDVDARALGGERRQVGGDHHGGDVAGADLLAADIDAEAFQHRLQRLLGERNIVEGIAGAVKADDEAVADELVLPHALDIGEVLDARRRRRRRNGTGQRPPARQARFETSSSSLLPKRLGRRLPMRIACQPAHDSKLLK